MLYVGSDMSGDASFAIVEKGSSLEDRELD